MQTMREKILQRLTDIGSINRNFPRTSMRWQDFFYNAPCGKPVHISELMFCNLDDDELLHLYDRVIIRSAKQM